MNLWQLVLVNVKRMIKDPLKLMFVFILPIGVIFFVNFLNNESSISGSTPNVSVAYNIEDEGDLWEKIYGSSSRSKWVFFNKKAEALNLLETNEVTVVYNIPSDFTEKINNYEKPIIEAYKREEGNVVIPTEIEINNKINEFIKEKLLVDKGIISNEDELYILRTETIFERNKKVVSGDMHTVTMMLIFFIILGSVSMVTELMEFKKKNILSRAITTPNSSSVILGGLILSLLFFQVFINSLVFFLGSIFFNYEIISFPIILVNFILASLFSITLSLVMVRIFNNESIGSLITALFSMLTLYLSMFSQEDFFPNVPQFVSNLGKFTPQYWIFDSLEKSVFFPNTFIVALMVLALFSAGSYKLKDFVRK